MHFSHMNYRRGKGNVQIQTRVCRSLAYDLHMRQPWLRLLGSVRILEETNAYTTTTSSLFLQNAKILPTTMLFILTLSLFPPTNFLHAQTWPRSHPTYKKIDKPIIAPAVHATFNCHHLKTSRSIWPENSWMKHLFQLSLNIYHLQRCQAFGWVLVV